VPASAPAGRPQGALSRARARWFRPASAYWSPELYEHYFARTPLGARLRRGDDRIVHAALDRLVAPHDEVLEIGSGTGHYTVTLARRCARVTALDAAPDMAGYLRRRVARDGLGNVEAGVGRLPDAIGPSGPFDGVVCLGVLGYVGDLDAGLRALAGRLRPGGWMLVSLPPLTLEGRVHALVELLGRRRVSLRSSADAVAAAHRAGLSIEGEARAGLTAGGITLLLEARRGGDGAPG
jgi:SAM-dependent methyltransferase